jgi:hypothetical protein
MFNSLQLIQRRGRMPLGIGMRSFILMRMCCSPTGRFTLPNPMSHVSSAAFAQAGSGTAQARVKSAQVCSHPINASHQKSLTFNERLKMTPLRLAKHPNSITFIYS